MPVTFAHPIVAVPARRLAPRWLDLTALVIGSMAPDTEYMVRWAVGARIANSLTVSHTLPWGLIASVLVACAVTALWQLLLKRPVLAHLPAPLDRWFSQAAANEWKLSSPRPVVVLGVSAFLGCVSHLFWDSFTHFRGFFVLLWPQVLAARFTLLGQRWYVFKALQYASGVLGCLLLVAFLFAEYRRRVPIPGFRARTWRARLGFWAVAGIPALLAACLQYVWSKQGLRPAGTGNYAFALLTGGCFGLFCAALLWRLPTHVEVKD